jgi:hypothetical protein
MKFKYLMPARALKDCMREESLFSSLKKGCELGTGACNASTRAHLQQQLSPEQQRFFLQKSHARCCSEGMSARKLHAGET